MPVYMTDAEGRITFYNEAAATLWGCRPELGKDKFCGSWKLYWPNGTPLSHAQTIRNVVEEGVFAEQAGVDFFGIGEHHTDYFPMPAGDVALAAIAARTERIHLGFCAGNSK